MSDLTGHELSAAAAEAVFQRARCLHSAVEVEARLDAMGAAVAAVLGAANPVVMCVMNGGLVATGKLLTRWRFPLELDYLHVGRYGRQTRGGALRWLREPAIELRGRSVLLVDDILDEGATMACLESYCAKRGCERTLIAVLVEKRHQRKVSERKPDFVGLEVEDRFLIGYGMDYQGYWRNAPGIYALAESDCH